MSWRRGDDNGGAGLTVEEPKMDQESVVRPEQTGTDRPLPLWRKLAVGAIFAVLVGGLAAALLWNSDEKATPPAPKSPAPTPAVEGTPPAPELRNTGEDFNAIVRSAKEFSNWVYQYDPDPKWAESFDHPQCDCFKVSQDGLATLKASGHRHKAPGVKVHKVILRDRTSPDQVTLYVVIEGLPGAIVDREGNVVQTRPGLPPTGFLEEWVRGPDGRWRAWQSTVLGPPPAGWEAL